MTDREVQLGSMNNDIELVFANIDANLGKSFFVLRHCL